MGIFHQSISCQGISVIEKESNLPLLIAQKHILRLISIQGSQRILLHYYIGADLILELIFAQDNILQYKSFCIGIRLY